MALQAQYPEADYTVQQVFADAPSQYLWGRAGWDGKYYVSTKKVKEEADFLRIMEYFDLMHSDEVSNLLKHGIEDRHYTKTGDNEITVSDDQNTAFLKEIEVIEQLGFRYLKNVYDVKNLPSYQAQYNAAFRDNEGICVADPTAPFNSETYNDRGKDLETHINDNNTKYITGAIDEAGWRKGIEDWLKMGGQDLIDDYQAIYDSLG